MRENPWYPVKNGQRPFCAIVCHLALPVGSSQGAHHWIVRTQKGGVYNQLSVHVLVVFRISAPWFLSLKMGSFVHGHLAGFLDVFIARQR